jgi:hypothetical protein
MEPNCLRMLSSYMCGKRAFHPTPQLQPPRPSPPTADESEQQDPVVAQVLTVGPAEQQGLLLGMPSPHVAKAGGRTSWLRWLQLVTMRCCLPPGEPERPDKCRCSQCSQEMLWKGALGLINITSEPKAGCRYHHLRLEQRLLHAVLASSLLCPGSVPDTNSFVDPCASSCLQVPGSNQLGTGLEGLLQRRAPQLHWYRQSQVTCTGRQRLPVGRVR